MQDLERLLSRVALESAGPRDLLSLGASLLVLPRVCTALGGLGSEAMASLLRRMDTLPELASAISTTLLPEPAATLAEGGVIAPGVHAELDELRATGGTGRAALAAIEERERTRTGIGSLKVRFTSVFGYYLEVTRSNLRHVPADYERKQTLVNAERFTTPELKELEHRILTAQERSVAIERELFAALRSAVLAQSARIRCTGSVLAEIDLLANFAHLAAERNYAEPELLESEHCFLQAVAARHPVIEGMMERSGIERFTPNDLYLDSETSTILLITGPNMGGKSTYLRQAALLLILAQMGSFVPAASMRYTPADRVYTRIGASDNLAHGRSTFMVEMTETATILNTATSRSLVLLDEMGRGTATFDGLALAWATLEHIHNHIGARTLFATHYGELTMLAGQLPRLRNARVSVKETPSGIVFLHTIEPGAASKSAPAPCSKRMNVPSATSSRPKSRPMPRSLCSSRCLRLFRSASSTASSPLTSMHSPLSRRSISWKSCRLSCVPARLPLEQQPAPAPPDRPTLYRRPRRHRARCDRARVAAPHPSFRLHPLSPQHGGACANHCSSPVGD